jgi:hypothetical protein
MIKYLKFKEVPSKTGKTKVISVISCWDKSVLGQISWLGKWRAYVFFPSRRYETFWSWDCLDELSFLIQILNKQHKDSINGKA